MAAELLGAAVDVAGPRDYDHRAGRRPPVNVDELNRSMGLPKSPGETPELSCDSSPSSGRWILLVALAFAPQVHRHRRARSSGLAASIGTLAQALFALISIVSPPRVRSAAFSTISVFAIPGIGVLLPVMESVRHPRRPGGHRRHGADRRHRRVRAVGGVQVRTAGHRRRPRAPVLIRRRETRANLRKPDAMARVDAWRARRSGRSA